MKASRRELQIVTCLLGAHAALLACLTWQQSTTIDEIGHLPAGIAVWRFGRFDVYSVNPPLIKSIAALPAIGAGIEEDWTGLQVPAINRPEWAIGQDFFRVNGCRSIWYWTLARWACVPFSLIGGYVCYRWARELFGPWAGLWTLALWCFSPNVLAYGATILPDLGAAAMGILALYTFRKWLTSASWERVFWAGLALGLAELTKMTWIILFLLWPLLWGANRSWPGAKPASRWQTEAGQLAVILLLGLYLLNVGYAFTGSLTPVGKYTFHSTLFTGNEETSTPGNRFADTSLAWIPVPLPRDYVTGIDLQKVDFEQGKSSVLLGEYRDSDDGGWWYFYLCALAIKEPMGIWVLLGLSIVIGALGLGQTRSPPALCPGGEGSAGTSSEPGSISQPIPAMSRADKLCLIVTPLVFLAVVSSETGFTRYLRYALPVLPFVYILGSRCFACKVRWVRFVATAAIVWYIASSLACYPYSFSYANELIGGPTHGMEYLYKANFDYGQDIVVLKDWIESHPDARPLYLRVTAYFDLKDVGIDFPPITPCKEGEALPSGWYAISIGEFQEPNSPFQCLRQLEPVDMVGYTIHVYHVE